MFSQIAMLVLQEQVRPKRYARRWRRKVKKSKQNAETTRDVKLKRGESKTKLKQQNSGIFTKAKELNSGASIPDKDDMNK